jgi:3-oxoacyl-[acyl-carrier-protein] synthase-1
VTRSVHVVALSARAPVGLRAESIAAAIRAGISGLARHPMFVDANGEFVRCGYDATLGPHFHGPARLVALGRAALQEMALALTGGGRSLGTVPLFLALPDPRPGMNASDRTEIARSLARENAPGIVGFEVTAVGGGHAGSLAGIAQAAEHIASGKMELCIVGGVDSYLEGATLEWLEENRLLDCEGIRGGFPPGEGAAMVALASDATRRQLALPCLATIRATASQFERRDPNGPAGLLGEALTEVFFRVAGSLRPPDERFDDLYCDINGERSRVNDLGFALMRTGQLFRDPTDYRTVVSQVGDLGVAAGALSCVLAARAWARRYASGPMALISGASWSGLRAAVLLTSGAS